LRIKQKKHFIFSLIFLVSCAGQKSQEYNKVAGSMVVDWSAEKQRVVPKIDEISPAGNEYGPISQKSFQENNSDKKKQKDATEQPMALLLGPGGYRTLSYLSLLKELHLRGETPHVIIGHGLASVLAAYYAFGYKPDYIEWKLFKFTKKVKDLDIYSEKWLEEVESSLIDDLASKKIEQGQLTLIVPVYSKMKRKVMYLKRGSLKEALMANVDLLEKRASAYRPGFYTEIIKKDILNDLGLGKVIIVDLLKDGINWKKGSGLLNGYFQKSSLLMNTIESIESISFVYPVGKYPIDDLSDSADLMYKSKEVSRKNINEWILDRRKQSVNSN